jgi:dipeptidyl aminopeptidase/acylaminoacyl peptidase
MKKAILLILTSILIGDSYSQNGLIVSRDTFDVYEHPDVMEIIGENSLTGYLIHDEYKWVKEIVMEEIFYMSDGLKVKAYLAYPKDKTANPSVIYNRGGNREFGALNPKKMVLILGRLASWGYTSVGSQYRGNDGGEGMEEFGGSDVNDVMNLIPLLADLPQADTSRMGMYGWSRGGMMTYLSLMRTCKMKAAVVGGAVADLRMMNDSRGGEMEKHVYSELIPDYENTKDSALASRSAITMVDKICKKTPILMMHGTADWRVIPEESLKMAEEFQKEKIPYRLVMFEGGDHGLSEFDKEVDKMVKEWFDKYLKKGKLLPDLEPHGK